jgi:hypothetical protein
LSFPLEDEEVGDDTGEAAMLIEKAWKLARGGFGAHHNSVQLPNRLLNDRRAGGTDLNLTFEKSSRLS